LCNFCITGISPGLGLIIEEFDCTLTQATWLISACLLGEFLGCYFIAPFSIKYGTRPLWLFICTVFFVCNIWGAVAKSFPSLLLARLFASWAGKRFLYIISFVRVYID
jgi:predicted MFS family arabinose efflux permease